MAYVTGTATDRNDLWTKLLAFLTADPALVAAGQAWEVVWSKDVTGNQSRVLKGKGLSGTDEVLVTLSKRDDQLTVGESVLWVGGCTGVTASANDIAGHVNSLQKTPAIFLDSGPMKYWFVANGRRFVVIVKISTVYNAMYAGLILPYSTPGAYKYPFFAGGSRGFFQGSGAAVPSWRTAEKEAYATFAKARMYGVTSSVGFDSQAFLLDPAGIWKPCIGPYGMSLPDMRIAMLPYLQQTTLNGRTNNDAAFLSAGTDGGGLGYNAILSNLVEGLDGEFPLTQITLAEYSVSEAEQPTTLGILDGCYHVSGLTQTSESIVQVGGVDHLVVQDIGRTTTTSYWSIALT